MKVRVWAYQDGVLLPDGFEAELVGNESVAIVPCLIALLEGLGIEVCVGDDEEKENFNQDVADWNDVTETGPIETEI